MEIICGSAGEIKRYGGYSIVLMLVNTTRPAKMICQKNKKETPKWEMSQRHAIEIFGVGNT